MLRVHRVLKNPAQLPENFWYSEDSELMLDQRWAESHEEQVNFLGEHLPLLTGHVWIASSGTLSTDSKWVAISKKAMLSNAHSVNLHLGIKSTDSWALTLPLSHVGGLSILARTYLLKQNLSDEDYQWISLVPTQVFDLVKNESRPPQKIRGAIVGGDALDKELYLKAIALGWPILRTYGMSELGSQLATEKNPGEGLKVLSHAQIKIAEEASFVKSDCLYTLKVTTDFITLTTETRSEEWWPLPDRINIQNERLQILGRLDNVIKVLGVKLDLTSLENELKVQLGFEVILRPVPDERRGQKIILFSENIVNLDLVNENLLGFQKISECKIVKTFPRTSLGKIKRGQLG